MLKNGDSVLAIELLTVREKDSIPYDWFQSLIVQSYNDRNPFMIITEESV